MLLRCLQWYTIANLFVKCQLLSKAINKCVVLDVKNAGQLVTASTHFCNDLNQGCSSFFDKGQHKLLHNSSRGEILRNGVVASMLHSTKSTNFS